MIKKHVNERQPEVKLVVVKSWSKWSRIIQIFELQNPNNIKLLEAHKH